MYEAATKTGYAQFVPLGACRAAFRADSAGASLAQEQLAHQLKGRCDLLWPSNLAVVGVCGLENTALRESDG